MEKFLELFNENVNVSDLTNALTVTWQGMAAIFVVMAVISLIVFLATKFTGIKK